MRRPGRRRSDPARPGRARTRSDPALRLPEFAAHRLPGDRTRAPRDTIGNGTGVAARQAAYRIAAILQRARGRDRAAAAAVKASPAAQFLSMRCQAVVQIGPFFSIPGNAGIAEERRSNITRHSRHAGGIIAESGVRVQCLNRPPARTAPRVRSQVNISCAHPRSAQTASDLRHYRAIGWPPEICPRGHAMSLSL